jgi:[protein-PII] uridylyltransferase
VVLEADGGPIIDPGRREQLRRRLEADLSAGGNSAQRVRRRAPRQIRMFPTRPVASFATDERNQRTVIELVAADQPGLLSMIGNVFRDQGIKIQTAKIATVGERAEDVFYVTNRAGEPLDGEQCDTLRTALLEALSTQD